jgi:hypothetical protein
MAEVFNPHEFLAKLLERDIAAFLKGGFDAEKANIGRALMYGIDPDLVRDCWAEARQVLAERHKQKEGA